MADPNTRRAFGTLVAAAYVDGVLTGDEKQVLHRKAMEMDIPIGLMNELLSKGEKGQLTIALPASAEERLKMLDDLIDVVGADGRIEGPEHHLLAKFAAHAGMTLPALWARVKERMRKPAPPPASHAASSVPLCSPQAPPFSSPSTPPAPLTSPPPPGPAVPPDIPPVTLHLIRQTLLFEPPPEAQRYVERMMGVTAPEAQRIIESVKAAFPDLRPGSRQVKLD